MQMTAMVATVLFTVQVPFFSVSHDCGHESSIVAHPAYSVDLTLLDSDCRCDCHERKLPLPKEDIPVLSSGTHPPLLFPARGPATGSVSGADPGAASCRAATADPALSHTASRPLVLRV
ncbi:MAG: hypothetical protein V1913_09865 [Fibrobacterota bacterium]